MPSSIKQRMSSQRRPWAHIYPLRSDGMPMLPNQIPTRTINNTSEPLATVNGVQTTTTTNAVTIAQPGGDNGLVNRVSPDFLITNSAQQQQQQQPVLNNTHQFRPSIHPNME